MCCLNTAGLTLEILTLAYPLIFCCRSRMIFYCRSRVTAGVPKELFCSIVLADSNQIDKVLKDLDDPAKSISNPGRGPMWMHDCLEEWFRLEPSKRIIAKTISKALTNQTNNWLTNQTNQQIKPIIDQLRPIDWLMKNNCLVKPKVIANKYSKTTA